MRSALRPDRRYQQFLPPIARSRRLQRRFKLAIVGLTVVGIVGLVGGTGVGRLGWTWLGNRAKWQIQHAAFGLAPNRSDVDREWRLRRALGVERTARNYRDFYAKIESPGWRRLLDAAGMAPNTALYRWANYDWTVILSSLVFEPDDTGRAYRMRPNRRAFWSRDHTLPNGLASFFFLPDTPEVRAAMTAAGESAIPESFQTTNSWGCRGPEPDPGAALRGLIVGDSFMQGLFVADDQTPPECLARQLRAARNVPVSILNTGHIGYSPEQYYQTLVEYFDRFRPHFVILSVCPNDFGNALVVLEGGGGDWEEGKYWIGQIHEFCQSRQVPLLLVPAPFESQVSGSGNQGRYPGQVSQIFPGTAPYFLNPVEAFTEENLRLVAAGIRVGKRPPSSPLFNGHLGDGHFSPRGAELWAQLVARRLALILDSLVGPVARQSP